MTIDRRRRDLADLRRNTAIWIGSLIWLGAGFALQEPARDPYDIAERSVFSWAMLILIPLITGVFVLAWIRFLRRQA